MPLDPLLANPTPIKIADPMEQYGEFLKNNYLQSEIQKAKMVNEESAATNKAWQTPGALNNGVADFGVVKNALAASGHGKLIPALEMDQQKAAADQAMGWKNKSEGDKFNTENATATIKQLKESLGGVSMNPQQGLGQIESHIRNYANSPVVQQFLEKNGMTPLDAYKQGMNEAFAAAQGGPDTWKQYMISQQSGLAAAHKMVTTQMDLGNHKVLIQTPEVGGSSTMTANMPVMMTPEQQQKMQLEASKNTYTQLQNGQTTQVLKMPAYGQGGAVPVASAQMQMTPVQRMTNDPAQQASIAGAKALTAADIKDYTTQHTAVQNLPTAVQHIDQALSLINKSNTGMGAKYELDANRMGQLLGLSRPNDGTAAYTQELNKKLNEFILDQMQGKNSGRTTNMMLKMTEAANAGIPMEPSAIRAVLLSKRADIQDQIKRHNDLANRMLSSPALGQSMQMLNMGPVNQVQEYGIPQQVVDHLRANAGNVTPKAMEVFDEHWGQPGAAARILAGGTPNGGTPFPQAGQ